MRILIIMFLILFTQQVKTQEITQSITIPFDSVTIKKHNLIPNVFNISLNIKSNDKRFFLDRYSFQVINGKSFDELSFMSLKEELKPFFLTNEFPFEKIKKMNPCAVHELFSFSSSSKKSNIYLIKKDKEQIYFWRLFYTGTSKNDGTTYLD